MSLGKLRPRKLGGDASRPPLLTLFTFLLEHNPNSDNNHPLRLSERGPPVFYTGNGAGHLSGVGSQNDPSIHHWLPEASIHPSNREDLAFVGQGSLFVV